MSDYQEYPEVVQEVRGALNPGRLKLQSSAVVFKNIKTGRVDQFPGDDVEKVQWLKRAKGFCLKIMLQNGQIHRFDGFKETDYEKLSSFVANNYNTKLERVDLSVKGWNWGITKFEGNGLNFAVDNNLAFEIPLNNVSHTTTSKNEVTLEFHQNDDAAVSLIELRFHIPTGETNPDKDTDQVQEFYETVIKNADIIQATGDAVCVFPEVQCLTPRGRYDIKIYTTFLQLHGKTFDYKIPYTTVLRLFLLPHKDGRQIFFVVSLDPPIKQGQTRYHFLILLFYKDDEMSLEVGLSEEELQEKYEGKLQTDMSGLEYEVVSKVFKAVTTRKITVPGNFTGHSGTPAIACSYKAATGLLYPLERGFIFVHKPPVHIRFDELAAVNFARSAGSTRSFDFDVETKAGNVYTFSSIEKDEYSKLFEFVKKKNLRMKNIGLKGAPTNYEEMMDSDNEDTHDAYLERMKAEGKDRDSDDMDDDSDSSDEDFNPAESASDVAEEYDSNPPTSSDSDSDYSASGSGGGSGSEAERRKEEKRERKEKRQKEKAERKSKSAKTVREGGTKKKKKSSKDIDPDRPKRPQTAYFLWFMEQREKIKSDLPHGAAVTDISKKAGELWKEMSSEDKKEYEEKAREAKEEYNKAMEEYNRKQREEGTGGGREDKPTKEKKAKKASPKKVVSETRAGAGGDYKSKEFISSSSSSGSDASDTDDKPLKKKVKKEGSEEEMDIDKSGSSSEDKPLKPKADKKKVKKKEKKAKKDVKKEEGSSSEEDSKPLKTRAKRAKDGGDSSDAGSLPDEEEILSSPEHSGHSAASGSDSE